MRKLFLICVCLCFAMLFVGTGCTDKKPSATDTIVAADTLVQDTLPQDTLEALLEEQPMPKAADELFDDFFFNFAANRRLQRERTDFPLPLDSYGKLSEITTEKWQPDRFFMHEGFYTLVFNSERQMDVVKDTTVSSVTVEKIVYERNMLMQWHFNRVAGLWRLQKKEYKSLDRHADADFLKFYHEFATDSTFQQASLAETVEISAPDPDDDFSRMEGSVMAEQWPMFAPWMPTGDVYNIHYGSEPYKPSSHRIFIIRGISNGLETLLTFKREDNEWRLVKMES